jgi:hypothetical protein
MLGLFMISTVGPWTSRLGDGPFDGEDGDFLQKLTKMVSRLCFSGADDLLRRS